MGEINNVSTVREEKSELEIFAEGALFLASLFGGAMIILSSAFGCNNYRPLEPERDIYSTPSYVETNIQFIER